MKTTNKFQKFIDLAYALFDPAHSPRTFHVSFILYKNRIISIGINNAKTTPVNLLNPKYGKDGQNISGIKGSCSEWVAISKMKNMTNIRFCKSILVNVRLNRNKIIDVSRPCHSCQSLILFLNLKKVFYTNKHGLFEE